jgi:hypothetical protein
MKIAAVLTAAAATTTVASGNLLRDPKTVVQKQNDGALTEGQRRLATQVFDSCLNLHMNKCKQIIDAAHAANPAAFGNVASILYITLKVRPVLLTADILANPDLLLDVPDYQLIGLRTDSDNTHVVGIKGDGIVTYPYSWCVTDAAEATGYRCQEIGPWDCYDELATPPTGQTFVQCCNDIKAETGHLMPDMHGNYLDCYNSPPPLENLEDPLDLGRVYLHIDANNRVVHPPYNG